MRKEKFLGMTMKRMLALFFLFAQVYAESPHPVQPHEYIAPDLPSKSFFYTVDIEKLQARLAQPIPEWMVERVQKELAPFKEIPISQEALKATFAHIITSSGVAPHYVRYRIVNRKIYRYGPVVPGVDHYHLVILDAHLRTLARFCDYPRIPDLPDVDFILNLSDGIPCAGDSSDFWIMKERKDQAPVFTFARKDQAPYLISLPGDRFTLPEWWELSQRIHSTNGHYAWKNKKKKAIWRGQPTDFSPHFYWCAEEEIVKHYSEQPRYRLCALSLLHPDLIDAGFNAPGNSPSALINFIKSCMKTGMSPSDHLSCAYLPVLDGAMCTYPGYLWRLLSNSVVFKQEAGTSQWFYDALKPYVHYIPVHHNMDNLVDQIIWAKNHDKECQAIAARAKQFVQDHLMYDGIYLYQLYQLLEYKKCQAFSSEDLANTPHDPQWVRIR